MYYFARTKMGFSKEEFWRLTLREFISLRDEYIAEHSPVEEKEVFADEIDF
jgi:hypothetical protein